MEQYETRGKDGVIYRITSVDDATTRGSGGVPTTTERSFTVEATDARGDYSAASFVFFQWILSTHNVDPWGNPLAADGIELAQVADSVARLWRGRVKWTFPTAVSAQSADDSGGGGYTPENVDFETFSYVPFISSFTTAGGTQHVTVSQSTRAYNITDIAPDFGGGIGWNGEEFEGVDISKPSIQFEVTARTPAALVANFGEYLNRVVPYVGTVNANRFFGCDPGTVLFLGCTSGQLKTRKLADGSSSPYWEMSLSFAASPNMVYNVAGVAVVKNGWEYLWTLGNSNGGILSAYVEQVYPVRDFGPLGLGGR